MRVYFNVGGLILLILFSNPKSTFPDELSNVRNLWGKEPVEKITSTRKEIVLNGIWKFMPAIGDSFKEPKGKWEYIRVPGVWKTTRPFFSAGLIDTEKKEIFPWEQTKYSDLGRGWYERKIFVPELNKGEDVFLKIDKIYTDAVIFIDGKECGKITFPSGKVNISDFVRSKGEHTLTILVLSTPNPALVDRWDEDRSTEKSNLRVRGIVGNVILKIRPREFFIEDVFIKTSVKEKKMNVEFTVIKNIPDTEHNKLYIDVKIKDMKGNVVKTYQENRSEFISNGKTDLKISFKWENPKLWDYKQPNLYYLYLKVTNGKYRDEIKERFGFREFRIEGTQFILNGEIFRLRPILGPNWELGFPCKERIKNNFLSYIDKNFNTIEPWPWGESRVSTLRHTETWAEVADEVGIMLIYPLPNINSYYPDIPKYYLKWDKYKKVWEEKMIKEWKKVRNHPSIIFWMHTPNFFASSTDCDPHKIGNSNKLKKNWWLERVGIEACKIIKKYDPTRPVTTHHGANVGDIHTQNVYLDLTPLQEREEWLKEWARNGDKPFMAIEFGTPFSFSFLRGRGGHTARFSEPLITEFCAIYFGKKAYELEPSEYRDLIKKKFISEQKYSSWGSHPIWGIHIPFLQFQSLFIKNTWRSWRTFGWSGGGIPWENAWGWRPVDYNSWKECSWGYFPVTDREVEMPPFSPGKKGGYLPKVPEWVHYGMNRWEETISGKTLREVNNPTLMYIGGKSDVFYEKGHHFFPGEEVEKQIILINDSRKKENFFVELHVLLNGKKIKNKKYKGEIEVGEIKFLPFKFKTPKVRKKTDGEIIIKGFIGKDKHHDTFSFSIYPETRKRLNNTILIYDCIGETEAMLKTFGFKLKELKKIQELSGYKSKNERNVLIIGKNSLLKVEKDAFPYLKKFVSDGGRVIIFAQNPDWIEKFIGLRVSKHVSRKIFPVATQKNHPIIDGFDEEDFRDWRGKGTLIPEFFYDNTYGWHYGNNGSVTSAAIEKPHFGGWKPILEGEFDLAYTPLMELEYGKGCVIFCTLDFENREKEEPMVEILVSRILNYAFEFKSKEKLETYYIGKSIVEKNFLKKSGLIFKETSCIPEEKSLLIIGSDTEIEEKEIINFLRKGGKIIFFPRKKGILGFNIKFRRNFPGSINIPCWEVLKGLSYSDLRFKTGVDIPLLVSGHGEIGADGLLGRLKKGKGVALFIQIMPYMLNSEVNTYFRYTEWRITRAICNIISNMGGFFRQDEKFFNISSFDETILLEGEWKYQIEYKTASPPPREIIKDPGNIGEKKRWHSPDFDDSLWNTISLPGRWNKIPEWGNSAGAVWVRKKIKIPSYWENHNLKVYLGVISLGDIVYFNGVKIGSTGPKEGGYFWRKERAYQIPSNIVKRGENLIAIRVFNYWGPHGGLNGYPEGKGEMRIEKVPNIPNFYTLNFREDDNPYRYHNW